MKEKAGEYYTKQLSIGSDFFTAPELDRVFGYAVGELAYELLKDFEDPTLLELGAGNGTLAYDILSFLKTNYPEFFQRVKYVIY
ncbi:SAM-dependent methyltransferase, partial [Thermocrinis sp.]